MSDLTAAGIQRQMATSPLLRGVELRAVSELAGEGRVRRYQQGTYLFHQGDPSDHIFFLVAGRVEVSSVSVSGHRQLLTTLEPAQFFGELGIVGDQPRTATCVAVEDSAAWVLGAEGFLAFLSRSFEATRALLRALAGQIQAHESFVEDLLFLDLKGRVAKRLLQLVSPSLDELPQDGTVLPSALTHADLASLCGGSRENVTRILSEFQKRGMVAREGRRYVLRSVAALRRVAALNE